MMKMLRSAMPWLSEGAEDAVRLLVEYLLPLAYDDHMTKGLPSSPLRHLLRLTARARCRVGYYRHPVDYDVFRRHETVGVAGTYLS